MDAVARAQLIFQMLTLLKNNLHTGYEMNRAKIKHVCVENMVILASEVGNLYFISDVYKMKTFAVF